MFLFHFAQFYKHFFFFFFPKVKSLCHIPCAEPSGVCNLLTAYEAHLQAVRFQVFQLLENSIKRQSEKRCQ